MTKQDKVQVSQEQMAQNLRQHEEFLKKRREKQSQQLRKLMRKLIKRGKDPIKFFEKVMEEMD